MAKSPNAFWAHAIGDQGCQSEHFKTHWRPSPCASSSAGHPYNRDLKRGAKAASWQVGYGRLAYQQENRGYTRDIGCVWHWRFPKITQLYGKQSVAYCFPKWPSQLHHLPGLCCAAGWESDHRRSLCPPSTPLLQGLWHIWSFRPWGGSAQWWPGGAAPKPTVRVPMFTFELKVQLFHISSLLWFNNIICHMTYDLNSLIVICFFLIELYLYVCIDIYTHTHTYICAMIPQGGDQAAALKKSLSSHGW